MLEKTGLAPGSLLARLFLSALAGALAASLGTMGARIGQQATAEQTLDSLSHKLAGLMRSDCEAYEALSQARRLPADRTDRPLLLASALERATDVPLTIAKLACEAGHSIAAIRTCLSPAVQSDLTVGMILAIAATEAGLHTAKTNIKLQRNQSVTDIQAGAITKISNSLEELKGLCYTPPPST